MPDVHLAIGSSTASRTLKCPAWLNLRKLAPQIDRESADAARGTRLHEKMEAHYGADVPWDNVITGLDEHDTDQMNIALGATEAVLEQYLIDEMQVEKFLRHPDREDCGGTGDMVAWSDDTFMVLDYKFGRVPVDNFDQFLFLMWMATLSEVFWPRMQDKKLVCAIIQPAVSDKPIVQEFTLEELDAWTDKFEAAIKLADDGAVNGNPGSHCKYCIAAPYCPAKRASVNKFMAVDPHQSLQLSVGMELIAAMKLQIAAVEAETFRVLEAGYDVEGFKLVLKRGSNHWIDGDAALAALRKQRTIPKSEYIKETLLTAPKVLAAVKKMGGTWKPLSALITNASTGTTLAPASDKRDAVKPINSAGVPKALDDILSGK